jgi:hypothetical protein
MFEAVQKDKDRMDELNKLLETVSRMDFSCLAAQITYLMYGSSSVLP